MFNKTMKKNRHFQIFCLQNALRLCGLHKRRSIDIRYSAINQPDSWGVVASHFLFCCKDRGNYFNIPENYTYNTINKVNYFEDLCTVKRFNNQIL